jgi:uncharacterized protein (TIGR00661 family)
VNKKQLRILVAPLDWGLGHVTRCVPIIQHILSLGHQVIFAGNKGQQEYVRTIFFNLEFLFLEGYNVQYSKTRLGFAPKIIGQIPRLKKCIKREHLWLQNVVKTNQIDAVIADNRYGLYHAHIPCVIITHQLQIRSGLSNLIDNILLKIHYKFIERFKRCWVVDIEEDEGLSGILGHPNSLPKIKTDYIGLLSQCTLKATKKTFDSEFYVLILLSGTEPQRTILSDILWKKAIKSDKKIIFVSGSNQAIVPEKIPEHISYHQRLSAKELMIAINTASIVICRSGYSSLMDLLALNKKAILIPTPGQTEQEYLAKLMHKQKIFMKANQSKFDIQTSLINASVFPFSTNKFSSSFQIHQSKISEWIDTIS